MNLKALEILLSNPEVRATISGLLGKNHTLTLKEGNILEEGDICATAEENLPGTSEFSRAPVERHTVVETRPSTTEALPSTVLPIVVRENLEQTELTAANCNAAQSPQIAEVTGQLHSIKFGSIPSEGCQDLLVPTSLLLPAQSSLSDGGDQVCFNPQLPLQVETYIRAKTSQTGLLTTKVEGKGEENKIGTSHLEFKFQIAEPDCS
ncbi:adenine nucleotide alpha hydrolases-likesuperfamily protein [Striga asiatica]|uniref:Adenine nucleotide alpha hydrolases-likesuperfamily protein n=1 Tax=Striga asiatica TaxID=4170 RepID=A0A5A7RKF1_STRAF|nr:adenine nucleotide alpha hydrolases-likesuperfamily protein [Striga asiatica]